MSDIYNAGVTKFQGVLSIAKLAADLGEVRAAAKDEGKS
jgi:hypothetical protein